ncbi:MAG: hypothetical protein J5859_02130, partial [Clostridia bacterium]|nr:hypothetical protein [Clostridia bacterium]
MRPKRFRYLIFFLLVILVFGAMFGQLARLQFIDSASYAEALTNKSTRTISVTGKRGTIYDRNMTVLAYDRESYNIQFYRDPDRRKAADRAAYTQTIKKVIEIVEGNGNSTVNDFWLARDEQGNWQWNTGGTSEYVINKRMEQWRANFYLSNETKYPVDVLFDTLCTNYSIDPTWDEDLKIKILSIWQTSRMSAYLSTPVTIAFDVSSETVAEIESDSTLEGISISIGYERVYPQGTAACHIIGYVSRISSSSALEDYIEKGYSSDSLVGMSGIEASMEDQLTASISYRRG